MMNLKVLPLFYNYHCNVYSQTPTFILFQRGEGCIQINMYLFTERSFILFQNEAKAAYR